MKISRQSLAPKLLHDAVNEALPLLGINPESPEANKVMRNILELVRETRSPVWNIIPGATEDYVTIARGAHFNNGVQIIISGGQPQVSPIGRTKKAIGPRLQTDQYNGIPLSAQNIPSAYYIPPDKYNW